jgi:glycosyltransferase involved in cell wall biosynthesis
VFQYPGWRNEFPDDKMNLFYNVADCFIFGGNEGFGLPVLEAQAAGCPVLVGDCTTMPELCEKESLIPIKDYYWNINTRYAVLDESELARKLEELAKNPKRVKKDLTSWDWTKVCEEWKKLIV